MDAGPVILVTNACDSGAPGAGIPAPSVLPGSPSIGHAIEADITVEPGSEYKNGSIVFGYQGPGDFFFAGLWIGQRGAAAPG